MKSISLIPALASLVPLAVALRRVSLKSNGLPSVTIESGVIQGATTTILGALHKVTKYLGGSLSNGANPLDAYDGSYLAALEGAVIVTVNYRTNVFGFPRTPELPANAMNLGHSFLDQRFALAWVQRTIAAFGGDPAKVTIFGQSAGSEPVDALVRSFSKNAPFRAAIEESGQSTFLTPPEDPYAV
ncbi:hypothetical protein FANTH_11121 [Fusarium anthophilum]|uniref:Carboxylic ester hydrolase n=1 Tax=Fusarium anthophilum TaxID=48485 RepID=A0A8H4YZI7_9HYPO|nr:hypothetical protein FANTH_11121 [Fusarium anthophilum]